MRKIAALVLLGFYLFASLGVMVHIHYCGGKIADIGILVEAEECCNHKKDDCSSPTLMNKACCSDESLMLLAETPQLNRNFIQKELPKFETSIHIILPNPPENLGAENEANYRANAPPDGRERRINLCSLTYYG